MRARGATAVVAALALAGYGTLDALDVVPGVLTTSPVVPDPAPYPRVDPAAVGPVTVPGPDPDAPRPTSAGLAALVAALEDDYRLTGDVAVAVADTPTGDVLFAQRGDEPRTAASSVKVLTAAAALDALGQDHRLTTRAWYDGAGTLVLDGGGDVLLGPGAGDPEATVGHAGLGDLAAEVAESLAVDGVGAVDLRLDDTLFRGPTRAPAWSGVDLDYVMPIQPLAVDTGRTDGGYAADPALDAARTFGDRLEEAGIDVMSLGRGTVPEGAVEVGALRSAPIAHVVRYMLKASDNTVAEVLARLVAVERDATADFTGATAAVLDQVAALGFDVTGATMADASGLSVADRVPASLLVEVVRAAVVGEPASLASVATSLPVAGLDGTLAARMNEPPAAGLLRAKTGTLIESVTLTGFVVTADGRPLAFSVLGGSLEPGTALQARLAIDDFGEALAACGCR